MGVDSGAPLESRVVATIPTGRSSRLQVAVCRWGDSYGRAERWTVSLRRWIPGRLPADAPGAWFATGIGIEIPVNRLDAVLSGLHRASEALKDLPESRASSLEAQYKRARALARQAAPTPPASAVLEAQDARDAAT